MDKTESLDKRPPKNSIIYKSSNSANQERKIVAFVINGKTISAELCVFEQDFNGNIKAYYNGIELFKEYEEAVEKEKSLMEQAKRLQEIGERAVKREKFDLKFFIILAVIAYIIYSIYY